MDQLVLTLVILLAAVLAEPLGTRIGLAPSILMTLFGCLLALIPAVPGLNIPPELILPLVLPPLLYAAARRTSWRQFAENWQIIALRAVGLVIVTAIAVAAVFHAWNPATTGAAAVVLGALVAPPDPVAATSMAGSLGLPRCLIVTLGEMLITGVQIGTRQERAVEQALWTRVVNAELKAIAARDDLPEDIYTEIKDTLRRLSAKADPELAGADAEAALDKERKSASQMRAVRAAVTEAGRREAQAARREPGMPPDVVDRVTRRLDLGPTR